jgi:solute carrier family 35 protein F5
VESRLLVDTFPSLQTIFADNTYSKPFFVTYINTSFFILPLTPIIVKRLYQLWSAGKLAQVTSIRTLLAQLDVPHSNLEQSPFLKADDEESDTEQGDAGDGLFISEEDGSAGHRETSGRLGLVATAKLSIEFCMLWVRLLSLFGLFEVTNCCANILSSFL